MADGRRGGEADARARGHGLHAGGGAAGLFVAAHHRGVDVLDRGLARVIGRLANVLPVAGLGTTDNGLQEHVCFVLLVSISGSDSVRCE